MTTNTFIMSMEPILINMSLKIEYRVQATWKYSITNDMERHSNSIDSQLNDESRVSESEEIYE